MVTLELSFEGKQLAKNSRDVIDDAIHFANKDGEILTRLVRKESKVIVKCTDPDFNTDSLITFLKKPLKKNEGAYKLREIESDSQDVEPEVDAEEYTRLNKKYQELGIEKGRLTKKYEKTEEQLNTLRNELSQVSTELSESTKKYETLESEYSNQVKANHGLSAQYNQKKKQVLDLESKLSKIDAESENLVDARTLVENLGTALIKTVELYSASLALYSEKKNIQEQYTNIASASANLGVNLPRDASQLNEEAINNAFGSYKKCVANELKEAVEAKASLEKLEKLATEDDEFQPAFEMARQSFASYKKLLEADEKINEVQKQALEFQKNYISKQIIQDGNVSKTIPIVIVRNGTNLDLDSYGIYLPKFSPLSKDFEKLAEKELYEKLDTPDRAWEMYKVLAKPEEVLQIKKKIAENCKQTEAEGFNIKVLQAD